VTSWRPSNVKRLSRMQLSRMQFAKGSIGNIPEYSASDSRPENVRGDA
jgi:hypothetical protein